MPETTRERRRKRTREGSSQTDEEEVCEEHGNGCQQCLDTNTKLVNIDEKLATLIKLLPEFEAYKSKVNELEKENKDMQKSIEDSQAEIKDLKVQLATTTSLQQASSIDLQRLQQELADLHRRHVKLECHSRRGNMKFFGIRESEYESSSDTEESLRKFMSTNLKIPQVDVDQIQFDRVHRISSRQDPSKIRNPQPRPIIVKLSQYQDKDFIKSFIKNLPKGSSFGVSDDFPKEVDEIRKKLYPLLKAAKQEKKQAYFKVEKLIIDGNLYRGTETSNFPIYGRLMDN